MSRAATLEYGNRLNPSDVDDPVPDPRTMAAKEKMLEEVGRLEMVEVEHDPRDDIIADLKAKIAEARLEMQRLSGEVYVYVPELGYVPESEVPRAKARGMTLSSSTQ